MRDMARSDGRLGALNVLVAAARSYAVAVLGFDVVTMLTGKNRYNYQQYLQKQMKGNATL